MRDGKKAVESATRACSLSGWNNADDIGTLAAAYAEAGDFASATRFQSWAQELYGSEEDRKFGHERLELYEQGKAYHERE
jgi:hypothetical protein